MSDLSARPTVAALPPSLDERLRRESDVGGARVERLIEALATVLGRRLDALDERLARVEAATAGPPPDVDLDPLLQRVELLEASTARRLQAVEGALVRAGDTDTAGRLEQRLAGIEDRLDAVAAGGAGSPPSADHLARRDDVTRLAERVEALVVAAQRGAEAAERHADGVPVAEVRSLLTRVERAAGAGAGVEPDLAATLARIDDRLELLSRHLFG